MGKVGAEILMDALCGFGAMQRALGHTWKELRKPQVDDSVAPEVRRGSQVTTPSFRPELLAAPASMTLAGAGEARGARYSCPSVLSIFCTLR